jgi:hypothetical protein
MRGTEEMSVASASYRAVNEKADMALLELLEAPPAYYQPYYAGWSLEEKANATPYAGIHHPRASVKRLNLAEGNLTLETLDIPEISFYRNAHWRVKKWQTGSTDAGSSGSPLFDSAHRIVGLLSGGRSTCGNPEDDYYYAFSKAWASSDAAHEQLKIWLNPSGSGQLTLDGFDPYGERPCYRLSNVFDTHLQDRIHVASLPPPASGDMFGINSLQTSEYAEAYHADASVTIEGVYVVTPAIQADGAENPEVEIRVYQGANKPQTLVHSETFRPHYTEMSSQDSSFIETEKRLNREQESFVRFSRTVSLSGTFYVGYKIKSADGPPFAVYNLPQGLTSRNTAWVSYQGGWISASSHPLTPFSTSLFIDPVVRYTDQTSGETIGSVEPSGVLIRADRSRRMVHVWLPPSLTTESICRLYTSGGQLMKEQTIRGGEAVIAVDSLPPGIYLVNISGRNIFYTQKVVF